MARIVNEMGKVSPVPVKLLSFDWLILPSRSLSSTRSDLIAIPEEDRLHMEDALKLSDSNRTGSSIRLGQDSTSLNNYHKESFAYLLRPRGNIRTKFGDIAAQHPGTE
jgi:hypothetical protein